MPSRTFVYRATIGLIWALALWHSWTCRGLFVDGSAFLVQIVRREWFFDFYSPRLYAMIVGQIPIMTAVTLGVTDLHLLGQLLSLGLFGLPTLVYTLALMRAKNDPVLLAVVIAAIAAVFYTTSFFIVGEYNTAYAIAILVAVRLATADRLTLGDGLVLAAMSFLAMRTYEALIYLGPLLAAMTLWQLWRLSPRPIVTSLLHLVAVGFFIASMFVAIDSVVYPHSAEHLEETYLTATNAWQNMQFDLAFGAAAVLVVWALFRPEDLGGIRLYRWAAICLVLLAASPLLAIGDGPVRPLAKSQYVARTVGGFVIAAMVIAVWAYAAGLKNKLARPLEVLRRNADAPRRLLAFACLMLLATLPSDLFLTVTWERYLEAMRSIVRGHDGLVAFESTSLSRRPNILLVENWVLSTQSLAMRSKKSDAIVLPPREFNDWVPFAPVEPPNIGRFYWRD